MQRIKAIKEWFNARNVVHTVFSRVYLPVYCDALQPSSHSTLVPWPWWACFRGDWRLADVKGTSPSACAMRAAARIRQACCAVVNARRAAAAASDLVAQPLASRAGNCGTFAPARAYISTACSGVSWGSPARVVGASTPSVWGFQHSRALSVHRSVAVAAARKGKGKGKGGDELHGVQELLDRYAAIPMSRTRNFCIIAHIDHGKSTLADQLLMLSGNIPPTNKQSQQVLDSLEVERARGITVKAQTASMVWTHPETKEDYLLNLIDTPGTLVASVCAFFTCSHRQAWPASARSRGLQL